jgi:hypothetical protein
MVGKEITIAVKRGERTFSMAWTTPYPDNEGGTAILTTIFTRCFTRAVEIFETVMSGVSERLTSGIGGVSLGLNMKEYREKWSDSFFEEEQTMKMLHKLIIEETEVKPIHLGVFRYTPDGSELMIIIGHKETTVRPEQD